MTRFYLSFILFYETPSQEHNAKYEQNVADIAIGGIWCRTIIIIVKVIKISFAGKNCSSHVGEKQQKRDCLEKMQKQNYLNKLMNYGFLIRC